MRSNTLKSILIKCGSAASVLLLAGGSAIGQVNLTAAPATLALPGGSVVPMWGYTCGAAVTGEPATCAKLNPTATGWSPVVITVPTGQNLTINLSNNLSFGANSVPTSLVIVGQLGGGLGKAVSGCPSGGGCTDSPDHSNAQPLTWPIPGDPPGSGLSGVGTPPTQGKRVQSFSTEVTAGQTTALTWTAPRPGTYLLESGTHPSIQGPMGLYGIVVVTAQPAAAGASGTAYPAVGTTTPAVTYSAELPLLFSEIDPVQNAAVSSAVNTPKFSETSVWSGLPGGCGNPASPIFNTCYPPAVNYTPLYYLINGVGFDKTNATRSLFPASFGSAANPITGNVLVRMVNAGLHMHVPSVVGALTGAPAGSGFSLIAEDGNRLPGLTRVQSEVFMAPGKTYDVMLNVPAGGGTALPIFDRELSLSGNATARDAGMLAYIGINGAGVPVVPSLGAAVAVADTYNSLLPGQKLTVSDPAKGVIANDQNVYGVALTTPAAHGTVTLNANGTFTYVATGTVTTDSFGYCANGTTTVCTSVTLGAAPLEAGTGITVNPISYTSNVAKSLSVKSPGVLSVDRDGAGYPLNVSGATTTAPLSLALTGPGAGTVTVDALGGLNASVSMPGTYTFGYKAQNSQGTVSAGTATVTLIFPAGSGLSVTVLDGKDVLAKQTNPSITPTKITDYRWVIEEDRTFYVDPNCTTNPPGAGCPGAGTTGLGTTGIVPTFGTNFHTSYMPVVATGCTGPLSCEGGQTIYDPSSQSHINAVCDISNGICRPDATGNGEAPTLPGQVALDPTKHYYISVLPGDAATPFQNANLSADCTNGVASAKHPGTCGHGMGGAPLKATCTPATGQATCTGGTFSAVTILTEPAPYPPSKLSVFVFEDDFPLNGEQDGGGGLSVLSPVEPGLGGFNITLFDDAGGTGDATGQMTYDMFNQPLVNSLAGQMDPATKQDACPISKNSRMGKNDPAQTGITGTIVTCPKYEADGVTLSPLAGQAVIANLMPGRYGVVATPAADRIARGEEWLQTNTLDGQKAHDSFLRIGEPSFFQEFGPAGYHVSVGFANPAIINSRKAGVCNGTDASITGTNCKNTVKGLVATARMSRTPDERLYSSGDNGSFAFTQCYVSFGDADGEDFAFTKCDANGNFTLSGLPDGDWRITVFDQWNDMLVDGLSTPVRLAGGKTVDMGQIAMNQWQANIYTSTFFDQNGNGVRDGNESGLTLVPTNIRFRDGSYSNFNNTDLAGNAGFNEVFPLFSWYVIETDSLRYKNTGTHVVYDAGGPSDGSPGCGSSGNAPCGNSNIAHFMANTAEQIHVPAALRVPGARYCAGADCPGGDSAGGSTGRVDPPWVTSEGWQGFSGQNSFIEFGKAPFAAGETGGIHGEVIYASTRPFDDPALLIHTSWTPDVPGVTINLYQEGTAPDGSKSLTLVDTTKTSSFDDWTQGFRSDHMPNMNCPGQGRESGTDADLFFFTLYNQPMYLDLYNSQHGGAAPTTLPNNSQFKCFDGMHNWNQVQPAPYDGMYQFPSIAGRNPTTGAPVGGTNPNVAGTNCTVCVKNPTDGTPMLPAGKYVVEMVVPPGYELVKEEDKNILIGDNYIAPVTQQFPGLGSAIYILPDQAEVSAYYNANNAQNPTTTFGRTALPSHEGDTGSVETFWPCVGAARIVPDYISLYPQSLEAAPFAGATRNLCDRKEVQLDDQTSALAKFWVFTSAHVAAHFTGVITDDYTSEFDPFSPQFGEKFSPANLPVAIKDWTGTEISRVYSDQWGTYNGLTYSTWEVNPPNPTGYAPTMMVTCMNDPGTGPKPDPLYNPAYSQFCYEIPFMPGQTQYMDTPVVPTSAFAGAGYNNPDCNYPDATPAVSEVDGDGIGPWVGPGGGHTLKIYALGNQSVNNYNYSGPASTKPPYNQKTVTRKYSFGTTAGTVALVGADGVARPLTNVSWGDMVITGTVPGGVPDCPIQQQDFYGGSRARCGQLVITAANGKQSVDTVTVTIGGKAPTHVAANGSLQNAIDAAWPGDLVIVDPATRATNSAAAVPANHQEMLLMWKPVRLQGVGAVSGIINANTHPAGKTEVWRREVNCLFGLALDGVPITSGHAYDSTGTYTCPRASTSRELQTAKFSATPTSFRFFTATESNPQIDRLPLEATVGWDATLNGNLAELLQEPTLMGALEGAAITVLAKGVRFPNNSNPFASDTFPDGTQLLTNSGRGEGRTGCGENRNPFPSSFWCNPSSIDGLTIANSSQGGGGIFVHGWGHNLQIANNRVINNSGTLSGGINVGQGEFPPLNIGGEEAANPAPGSCQNSEVTNLGLPYCFDEFVNVHHNSITTNSSTGDELFSATPAGAGGISFCTGSDYYKFNYNWVCGNLSSGDGGGLVHLGFSYNGDIEHNTFLFNQSTNPTIPTNGGGLLVMGAPDADPPCGGNTDQDCVATPGSVGPSDGAGPNLVINANLILGNAAESGSGGGLRLQNVNGSDVVSFPTNPSRWNTVNVTNNIIANNVAGWDGAGISLQDAFNVNIVNNTIMSNDTTASSGVLFNTIGAPLASAEGSNCIQHNSTTNSCPQPAGLVSVQNSTVLTSNLPQTITCPAGHFAPRNANDNGDNGTCRTVSYPELYNDVFWQNRSFYIGVGALGGGTQNQQHVVALYEAFTSTRAPSQPTTGAPATANGSGVLITAGTGACTPASGAPNYWDIGVRGDTGPANHASKVTLAPTYSVITDAADYAAASLHNTGKNPTVLSQYCNGSRVPPENGGLGYNVPAGIADATVPNPIFSLTPAATVDEGNNWINISWGPLALTNPSGATLGNYGPAAGSSVINYITSSAATYGPAPPSDFYGNPRKDNNAVDAGAIEFVGPAGPANASVTPALLAFGKVGTGGAPSAAQTLTLQNTGGSPLTGIGLTFSSARYSRQAGAAGGTCTASLAANSTCTINVVFTPTALGTVNATLTIAASVLVSGSPVSLSGTGVAPAALSIAPNPLKITVATPVGNAGSGTGTVTLRNTAAPGGASATVSSVAVASGTGSGRFTWSFSVDAGSGADNCSGVTLAPAAACTVRVRFRNVRSPTGVDRPGTITFTDSGAGSPHTGVLTGHANP
jgi:hypothetical protein